MSRGYIRLNAIDPTFHQIADATALAKKIAKIAKGRDAGATDVRGDLLADLKTVLADGRVKAEAMLFSDGKGYLCAQRLSHLIDVIVGATYNFALSDVFKASNLSAGERLTVVAVGGYGRGTLAPGSDVDLLFLLPYKKTPLSEQIAEYVLYMLWDLGLKVGHATRNVDECIRLSRTDNTICTALLEARYLEGDETLFEALMTRFSSEVIERTVPQFIAAKLDERDSRHKRLGEARYVVEPNVKDGKGGMRDLQTLFWIAKYAYRVRERRELVSLGVFEKDDYKLFVKSEDFLWTVRCHLHFETGKDEERLSFDVQRALAKRLNYHTHAGLEDVERFMKHYFLVTKDVGDLTRIFCAVLEDQEIKSAPSFSDLLASLPFGRSTKRIDGIKDFVIDRQRINIAEPDAFKKDPVNLIRMFHLADRYGLEYHPQALKAARHALKLIGKDLRQDVNANALFLKIITSRNDPELNLRRMNEAGVLGKFIPDFGRIVAMMQFNMYHFYTVDEHLIRTVGVLAAIEKGTIASDHPLAGTLVPTLSEADRTILYVTALIHDIAKGRSQDHSVAGAEVARKLCPRLGLSPEDTNMVAWLIEEHLTMSMIAQSRDLSDRRTTENFVATVQTMRRLKLLVILTVCDTRAVGPGVWNGWKGQLLRTLYAEAELVLTGGFSESSRAERAKAARIKLGEGLSDWPEAERAAYIDLHYENYLLTVSFEDQIRHANFVRETRATNRPFATQVRTDAFQAITEITVYAQDHPRLLSIIAGACSSAGAEIDGAHIFTTSDGRALDTILIRREFEEDADELRRGMRVGKVIEEVLSGKTYMPEIMAKPPRRRRAAKAFKVAPKITINNALSNRYTVVEVEGLDRPYLLSSLTETLSDLQLDIRSAHVTTFGEKFIDSFYVTDLTGQKVVDTRRQDRVRKQLLQTLDRNKNA